MILIPHMSLQRQIEVATMIQQLRGILVQGMKEENWTPDSVHAFSQIVSSFRALLVRPVSLNRSQSHNISLSHAQALHAHMQQLLLDCQIPDTLLSLLNGLAVSANFTL